MIPPYNDKYDREASRRRATRSYSSSFQLLSDVAATSAWFYHRRSGVSPANIVKDEFEFGGVYTSDPMHDRVMWGETWE